MIWIFFILLLGYAVARRPSSPQKAARMGQQGMAAAGLHINQVGSYFFSGAGAGGGTSDEATSETAFHEPSACLR